MISDSCGQSPEKGGYLVVPSQGDDLTQQFSAWQGARLSVICYHRSDAFGLFLATDHISSIALEDASEEDLFKELKQ